MQSAQKILVVDDEAVIRELLTEILSEEGYPVESAPSAPAALDLLTRSDGFVVLFTDIVMPEMDGIELIREARRVNPALIPIVMTGFATLETARDAVREGAYDYVLKPFSLSEVKLAVSNALERHRLLNENARLRELTGLFHISETIAAIHDEQRLLQFVLHAALERVGAERGSVMVTTPNGRHLEVAAGVGVPPEASRTPVALGEGISGWVAEHVEPLLVRDIHEDPELARRSQRLEDVSFISIPLERKTPLDQGPVRKSGSQSRVLAVLNVNRKRSSEPFTDGDFKMLSIVANHAAVALQNVRLLKDVEDAHLATLRSMALLLEAKDAYTHGHSQRVSAFAAQLAEELGMSQRDIETLRLGASLHDLGKVGVSDNVLNKRERLTSPEWESIKRHPLIGYEVLAPVRSLTESHLDLVRSHHERIDGTGYPDGLQGGHISDLARVLALADSYDAMSSDRAYRRAMQPDQIIGELRRCAASQFDPRFTAVFTDLVESGRLGASEAIAAERV